ncbi:hypothetical protein K438DRAFT_1771034 [Mycena galopus ATCC 62051]|nr:hypothetical protein K438DRAFT_1771034 [Mycena galopus ATCC 62051]
MCHTIFITILQGQTLDGNFKASLFFKHDDGSDMALTNAKMYFLNQADQEVPCKVHIGSICHQGLPKYGNMALSGVVACACDHSLVGSFIDMLKGEACCIKVRMQLLADEQLNTLRLFELHMAIVKHLSHQHATEVVGWSRLSWLPRKMAKGLESVYQHKSTKKCEKMTWQDAHQEMTPVSQWVHDGMIIERQQYNPRGQSLGQPLGTSIQETWATISDLRDTLNVVLKKFREQQRSVYPHLKLSAIDIDEPELTAVQVPLYWMKHRHQPASNEGRSEADNVILAIQAASLALSAVIKAREQDYRGQVGVMRSHRNVQRVELMKTFEITMYNRAQTALICLGYMAENMVKPYPPLTHQDTHRKDTHLHHAKGDSHLFDGMAWYLQSGTRISSSVQKTLLPVQLLAQATMSPCKPKRLKDLAPEDVVVKSSGSETEGSNLEVSPSKKGNQQPGKQCGKKKVKVKRSDGWIWLDRITSGQKLGEGKLVEYKEESDQVQWFRAEARIGGWSNMNASMELIRVIERYQCNSERLQCNTTKIFQKAKGAHADWVVAPTFDELVVEIDNWRDMVFAWMDEMDIYRVYKDFAPRLYNDMLAPST